MAAPENLLGQETSPYLLQHAANPVHWRPWGKQALDEARAANRPILVSIGYAACHWCHVMAHESFEDPETAALMNTLFVNIKIDREERPDIDQIYMSALHALGEQGGWPLTMFTTPDGTPFWGGTYFPPEPRWGRPSFRQVLQGVANAFHSKAEAVTQNTRALTEYLQRQATASVGDAPGPAQLDAVAQAYLRMTDPDHGGLRGAPKFPNPPIYRFLWQNAFRTARPEAPSEATSEAQHALHLMLQRMSQGGIYDHLGGGYARYSTDDIWLVPHFEKMLYDNAQLLELLAFAHADRPDPLYAQRAAETVGWMVRDMTAQRVDGTAAFAASEDADSEGEEGRFYVWGEEEIDGTLGGAAARFKAAYDVTRDGNWEGRTVLRRITPRGSAQEEAGLAASRAKLFALREARPKPGRDDKVLADWNGLTVAALALFEASGDPSDLEAARLLAGEAIDLFGDGAGGFYLTAKDAADVPGARPRQAHDGATPSGIGLLAEVFVRLWHLTDEARWGEAAEGLIRAVSGAPEGLGGCPLTLMSADMLARGGSVVIDGPLDDPAAKALAFAALRAPDPSLTVLRLDRASWPNGSPRDDLPRADAPIAMLCQGQTCSLPVTTPEQLAELLSARTVGTT